MWGDANVALGIINRNVPGKIRHISNGLLWIQQEAAEQRLKFGKVWGVDNLANLFTKYFDERTSAHHTTKLGRRVAKGRPKEAPHLHAISVSIDEHQNGGNAREWPWLCYLQNVNGRTRGTSASREHNGGINMITSHKYTTNVWQQVLWGFKQRVQGSNGWNAAQPSCLQGSTLTFQSKIGVSYGIGLRHGATMRPMGETFEGRHDPAAPWRNAPNGP